MEKIFTDDYNVIQANRVNTIYVPIGTINASDQKRIFVAPQISKTPPNANIKIIDVSLITETAADALDDTNYWTFQIKDVTAGKDLLSAAVTNKTVTGTAIEADKPYKLTPDQNNSIGNDAVIELDITKAGSAPELAECGALVTYGWEI